MKNTSIKLSKMQVNAIASEVSIKINKARLDEGTKKLEKSPKYKELCKISLQENELRNKLNEISKTRCNLYMEIVNKEGYNFNMQVVDKKVILSNVWKNNNNVNFNYARSLENEIIMMTIDPANDIQSIIDQLVKKNIG
jgi:hypothetical protein